MKPAYNRILLKISGEALAGNNGFGIDTSTAMQVASEIAQVHKSGVDIAIVIGGGNFLRGATTEGVSRIAGDTMGMLATVINCIAFAQHLESFDVEAKVLSAVKIDKACEFYTPQLANDYLSKGKILLLAAGTGNPFFTTDTAAALRCAEIGADVLFKATKVDGIYDRDPVKDPDAIRFDQITHAEALSRNLKVMDATSFSFCMEQKIPIIIFKLLEKGNLSRCIKGETIGSIIKTGG
ncbi:Uridine monophosphate kinase [Chitinispirillum alkaliphilum]|nr:Uridine monophosphate kinase [Chitinispirillum alkaliphilum]